MTASDTTSVCSLCGGTGTVDADDMGGTECRCLLAKRLIRHLGPEIAGVPFPRENWQSFLFTPKGEDYTIRNVVFKAYWRDLLPHLKWALGCKGPMFRFKILTDEKLRTVYVGAESYTSRPRSKRDDMATNNSLNDILGEEIDLVIIRLGFLGYKNVAMPGILKESLMLREISRKPTWIVESPDAPLVPGHFAYSEDVFEYILQRFTSVKISEYDETRDEGISPQKYPQTSPPKSVEDVDMSTPVHEEEVPAEALGEPPKRETGLERTLRERRVVKVVPKSNIHTDLDLSSVDDTTLEGMGLPSFSGGGGYGKRKGKSK
jgi:hypothetical protein